jgi:3'(2'), 5'-bisphosphate nucleotidase
MSINPIKEAVRQAAFLCRTVQSRSFESATKTSHDKGGSTEPVTIADYGSQAIICRALSQHQPGAAVISEESGQQFLELTDANARQQIYTLLQEILGEPVTEDDVVQWLDFGTGIQSEQTWVIDPIDGTKGFINRRHYAIGVGLLNADGQPVGAVMGAPGYAEGIAEEGGAGTIFYIEDGRVYREPLDGGSRQPVTVSSRTEDLRVVQSYVRKHASKSRMAAVRQKAGFANVTVYELDSMEKHALVACGDVDIYMRLPNLDSNRPHMIWDHAPGAALILAAGGKITDVDGTPLDFSQGKALPNQGILGSNGAGDVHEKLVAAAQQMLAEEHSDNDTNS